MDNNGDFATHSPESISQVIMALCSLGIDLGSDERFIKGGVTLMRSLDKYRISSGEYIHSVVDSYSDMISTTQALLALSAVKNSSEGIPLYSAVRTDHNPEYYIIAGFSACLLISAITMFSIRRKKNV